MTVHVHQLAGCAPSPLAHYLKALAVLRLVSEQRDPGARGFWKDECFWLATKLTKAELLQFFTAEYEPTPILNPWNGGSGFYFREEKSDERDEDGKKKKTGNRTQETAATKAIAALIESDSPRLRRYAAAAAAAKTVLADLGLEAAPDTPEDKAHLIALLRARMGDTSWIDAAVVSAGHEFSCAPLLGSGGNDGNEDFSKNFLERVLVLVGGGLTAAQLDASLFGGAARDALGVAAGQFFPAGNGGLNHGAGFEGAATVSGWEYLFAVEGASSFAGAASRRLDGEVGGASFPFTIRVEPAGYPSVSLADRDGAPSEFWLPLWSQPASYLEVAALVHEGRLKLARADARSTIEAARAVAAFGASRGVDAFERTSIFYRNGKMRYSVPTGRWATATGGRGVGGPTQLALLDDVVGWADSIRRFGREDKPKAPKAIQLAARNLDESILKVCKPHSNVADWQELLIALGRAEASLLHCVAKANDRHIAPLPPLRGAWVAAVDDGSPELRLALALASQDVELRHRGATVFANIRAHWMPLDRTVATYRRHAERRAKLAAEATASNRDPDVVCHGETLEQDLSALVARRVQLAAGLPSRGLGLHGRYGAALADINAFLAGRVDDQRILKLARPLMAIAWWNREALPLLVRPPNEEVDAVYAVVRLTHLSAALGGAQPVSIRLDPEPSARLRAGDLQAAVDVCLRRLRASGLSPLIRTAAGGTRYAHRIASSLAFPLGASDLDWCAAFVTKPHSTKDSDHVA